MKKGEGGGASRSGLSFWPWCLHLRIGPKGWARKELPGGLWGLGYTLAGGRGPGAGQPPPRASPLPPQLIYDAGVSFMTIMFAWSALACLIFLNCAANWPREAFPSPEEVNYK